jgi:hypothetical protein
MRVGPKFFGVLLFFIFSASIIAIPPTQVKAIITFPSITNYHVFTEQLIAVSPSNNITYKDKMPLNCTLNLKQNCDVPFANVAEIGYSIDNGTSIKLPVPSSLSHYYTFISFSDILAIGFQDTVDIPNLPNGIHQLTLFANGICNIDNNGLTSWNTSLLPISFSVYNSPPPTIVSFSPQKTSYEITNVTRGSIPLDFNIDKTTSWMGYSLDNQDNVTLTGNSTLTGLAYGNHTLTIFANDTLGNMGVSSTTNFTISKPKAIQASYLAVIVVVAALLIAVVLLLLYRRHRKAISTISLL